MKVFVITDPLDPRQVDDNAHIPEARNIDAYDVILYDGVLLVVGADGLYQFDYTGEKLAFISKIDLRRARR